METVYPMMLRQVCCWFDLDLCWRHWRTPTYSPRSPSIGSPERSEAQLFNSCRCEWRTVFVMEHFPIDFRYGGFPYLLQLHQYAHGIPLLRNCTGNHTHWTILKMLPNFAVALFAWLLQCVPVRIKYIISSIQLHQYMTNAQQKVHTNIIRLGASYKATCYNT